MKSKVIIISSILLVSTLIFGFAVKPNEGVKYEYIQIIQNNKYLAISSATEYKEIKISDDRKGNYDYKPIIKVIDDYQKAGYELVEHSIGSYALEITTSYLMRKPR
jgi:hypothetical protein